jgi:hypothetical protein
MNINKSLGWVMLILSSLFFLLSSCSNEEIIESPKTTSITINTAENSTTGKNVNRGTIFGQVETIQVKAKHSGGYESITDFKLVASGGTNSFIMDNVMFGQNTISATTTTAVTPDSGTITDVVPVTLNVTFTVNTDLVTLNAHGFTNGTVVSFPTVTTTTGISANTNYYVVSALTNTFKVAATSGGTAINLTGSNGTGTVLNDSKTVLTWTNKLPYAIYTGSTSVNINEGLVDNVSIPMTTQNSRLILLVDSKIGFTTNVEILVDGAPANPVMKFALAANTDKVIYWSDANAIAGKSISFKCDMFGISAVTTVAEPLVASKSMRRKLVLTNSGLTVTATKTTIN